MESRGNKPKKEENPKIDQGDKIYHLDNSIDYEVIV